MFSKIIILLLWAVCFIVKRSTAGGGTTADEGSTSGNSTVNMPANLDALTTKQRQELSKFSKYYTDNNGSISKKHNRDSTSQEPIADEDSMCTATKKLKLNPVDEKNITPNLDTLTTKQMQQFNMFNEYYTGTNGSISKKHNRDSTSTEPTADEDSMCTATKKIKLNPVDEKNINLDDESWENIFKYYVTNTNGSISPTELQKLIFNVFNGFLTIHQIETYKKLINSNESNKIELDHWKKMKPIIHFLSKGKNFKENANFKKDDTISENMSSNVLGTTTTFEGLLKKKDISDLHGLISQNELWPIQWLKYEKIIMMLKASLNMVNIHEMFCSIVKGEYGVIGADDLVKAYIDVFPEKVTNESAIKELATKTIKDGDLNHDGFLDFQEYMIVINNYELLLLTGNIIAQLHDRLEKKKLELEIISQKKIKEYTMRSTL